MKKLAGYFIQGVIYTVPITITFYVFFNLFTIIDHGTKSVIALILGYDHPVISLPGLGIVSLLILITFLGYIGTLFIAKPVFQYFQNTIQKAPLIKTIYSSIRDIVLAFVGKDRKFSEAVLVCINKENAIFKIGFITSKDLSSIGIENNMIAVYFPQSYGFSGELFIVSANQITPIQAKPADIMKFIFSGGIATIQAPKNKTSTKQ